MQGSRLLAGRPTALSTDKGAAVSPSTKRLFYALSNIAKAGTHEKPRESGGIEPDLARKAFTSQTVLVFPRCPAGADSGVASDPPFSHGFFIYLLYLLL